MAIEPISSSMTSGVRRAYQEISDGERLGTMLRRAREERSLTLSDVSAATKVPRYLLEMLERGDLSDLPAEVFVRGFIRSYSKLVSLPDVEPVALYDRAMKARTEATRVEASKPVVDPAMAGIPADDDREGRGDAPRRGLGLAVFVIILLLIATITLSLLLRRPPQSGEGLSEGPRPAAPVASLLASVSASADRADGTHHADSA